MDRPLVAVVLAGGWGSRLYPASRPDRPKQFLSLGGDRSLLEATAARLGFADELYVLTRPAYAEAVRDLVPRAGLLVEPEPRDTGPALTYATHRVREQVGECVLLACPSDHRIAGNFADCARRAAAAAVETKGVVTVGIEPTRPATGYGYVSPGTDEGDYYAVDSFVEKPDRESAAAYVERGYYWNAGVFAWTPSAFLSAVASSPLAPLVAALEDGEAEAGFRAVDPVSVDEAVLERSEDVYVVPGTFEWADLGTWEAVWRSLAGDDRGNVELDDFGGTVPRGEARTVDAEDCLVATDGTATVLGLSGVAVASFDGHTVVLPLSESQRVREVVDAVEDELGG